MTDSRTRPNFLIFIVDQMSSFSLACHGNPDVQTPHLDRLCASGVSFTRAYCCNPVCSPSRASLHTGLTPRQHGLLTNGSKLSHHIPTLPQVLAEEAYCTHCVGKIHLQPFTAEQQEDDGTPVSWESRALWEQGVIPNLPLPYYGYQSVDYIGGHVHYVHGDYVNDVNTRHPGTTRQLSQERASQSLPNSQTWHLSIAPERHYNHWIADQSIAFLNTINQPEQDQKNFFLVASFPDPHHPFAACQPYSEQYDPANLALPPTWNENQDPCPYLAEQDRSRWASWDEAILRESMAQTYGMISHIDENIGRVLDHLEATGLADNTIVVFLADHGEYLGAHHLLLKGPWPYEQVVRVPYIWRDPQAEEQAPKEDVVSLLDFVPTVLDYAGIDAKRLDLRGVRVNEPLGLPGRSLRGAIRGQAAAEDKEVEIGVLIEFDEDFYPEATCCRYRMLITSQFKLCLYGGTGDGVLFDLATDPHERHNLWADPSYAATKCKMLALLADRLAQTDRWDVPRYSGA